MSIYKKYPNLTIDELAMVAMHGEEWLYSTGSSYSYENIEDCNCFKTHPTTRAEAKNTTEKLYKPDKLCKNGHDSLYSVSSGCLECKRIRGKNKTPEQRKKENDARRGKKSEYYHTQEYKEYITKYKEENRERINEVSRNYYHNKLKLDPIYRLERNLAGHIQKELKGQSISKSWMKLVKFTIDELRQHLEKLFEPEMTWENYGSYWHLDHIKPKSLCDSFEEAWALSNLQPLKAEDNLKKNNLYIGHPNNPQWVDKNKRKNRRKDDYFI